MVGSQGKGFVSLCLRNLSISNENCTVLAEFLRKSSKTLEVRRLLPWLPAFASQPACTNSALCTVGGVCLSALAVAIC